jgi:hypothetical protein
MLWSVIGLVWVKSVPQSSHTYSETVAVDNGLTLVAAYLLIMTFSLVSLLYLLEHRFRKRLCAASRYDGKAYRLSKPGCVFFVARLDQQAHEQVNRAAVKQLYLG